MSKKIQCLMIGQAGIGKTSFLQNFPKCTKNEEVTARELYTYETLNNSFEKVIIEIENFDISLETCLKDADLIVNDQVISSSQIINTKDYQCIILCFAMDDLHSFELIKSKWEIDFKRNKLKDKNFCLLSLKSDTISSKPPNENENQNQKTMMARNSFKKRSCSVNSTSSTSKLSKNKAGMLHSDHDQPNIDVTAYKKFAKLISTNLINYSIFSDILVEKKSKNPLTAYEILVKNILSINNNKVNKQLIPKSISAPLGSFRIRKAKKESHELKPISSVYYENSSFVNIEETRAATALNPEKKSEPLTIRSKLSRLAIGIGTFVVTCGSNNSRRLADLKNSKNLKDSNNKSCKKNKSWLLLASETSLVEY